MIQDDIKYIDLEKTITTFGYPKDRNSRVVIVCQCSKVWNTSIVGLRRTLKKGNAVLCQSCRSKKVWEDPIKRNMLTEKILLGTQDPEYKKKASAIATERWKNPELRKRASENALNQWKDPEFKKLVGEIRSSDSYRQSISSQLKKQWKDPEYKEKLLIHLNKIHNNPSLKKKASIMMKDNWKDSNYRENITQKLKDISNTDQYREKSSERSKKLWMDPDYRQKSMNTYESAEFKRLASERSKIIWSNPELRKRASENSLRQWEDPKYRNKSAKARSESYLNKEDSIIERTVQNILLGLNTEYVRHHVIGHYEFDLFVPSKNLLIECQGEYWHSINKNKSRDAAKFTYISEYFPKYDILYLYERDFLNPGLIRQKIIGLLFGLDTLATDQINFSFSDLKIKILSSKDKLPKSFYSAPEEFLKSFHYAGYGRAGRPIYGAYLGDKLIAVCKFASIIRKEVATSMNLSHTEVLELDRFCIHPQYQKKNLASWMISRCSKLVFEELIKINCLVSFADSTYGHIGTIYKASNWTELYKTQPDYYYMDKEGFVIHKKTLYNHARNLKKKESEYAEEFGYLKMYGKEKTKFILKRNL